jgi:carbonic anhydrase
MSVIDEILEHNETHVRQFAGGSLPIPPAKKLAVVVCMDARLETGVLLKLVEGDAHVIRNAGGVVTDDVIRSLTISQRLLGTREIMLVHHTDCGMVTFTDAELKQQILNETGLKPPFAMETFEDVDADVRQSMARIHACPYIPHKDEVRGFVYDVDSGHLREVT